MTPEKAQAILDENFAPWVCALEPRVTKISADCAVLEIPITDQMTVYPMIKR